MDSPGLFESGFLDTFLGLRFLIDVFTFDLSFKAPNKQIAIDIRCVDGHFVYPAHVVELLTT
jgi:hypothetical protein